MSGDRSGLPAVVKHGAPVTTATLSSSLIVPSMIAEAGDRAARRFLDFFAASIENDNTRLAYYRAVCSFFAWLEQHGIGELADIEPFHVAAYLKALKVSDAGDRAIKERDRRKADRQAASGRDPHAVRLARRRPGARDQSGACGARAEARRQARQDAGAQRRAGPPAARQHQDHKDDQGGGWIRQGGAVARRPARSRADRRDGLQLRPHQRRRRDGGRGLLFERQALVAAAARERRQAPRNAGAPQARAVPRRISRRRRYPRWRQDPPLPLGAAAEPGS